MPTLSDRPMKERLELVEHFYAEEADHIGRTLRIQKGALNSILDYSLHSNLGVLKNLVQLSCAKAFLRENVAGNRTGEIAVTFSDLSFQTYNVSAETEKYAHGDLRFAEDLVVPNQRIQSSAADVASFVDVYDFVESRLSGEQEQHHDAGNLQQNLDELRDQIMEAYFRQMSHLFQTSGLDLPALREKYAEQTPEKVILSTCITGIGSARSIQEILQKRLAYIPRLHVVAVSALDSMEKLAEKYGSSLRLVVGTVEPNIPGVPFITADRVFSREGILEIASIVDDWGMDAGQAITGQAESAGGETISLLAQSLRYIAPHVEQQMAIDCIETMTQQLESGDYRRTLPQDVCVRLFMHAASMLERIVDGNPLAMEPEHEDLVRQNAAWFARLQALITASFAPFGYEIPQAEVFYFMLSLPQTLE